jgi:hypothetical protein
MNASTASGGTRPVRTSGLERTARAVRRDLATVLVVVAATGAFELALHAAAALHGTGERPMAVVARACPGC